MTMEIENVIKKIKDNQELIRPYYRPIGSFDVQIEDGEIETEGVVRGDITLYIHTSWKTRVKKKFDLMAKRIKRIFKAKYVSFCDVNTEKNEPFFWAVTLDKLKRKGDA